MNNIKNFQAYINGKFVNAIDNKIIKIYSPENNQLIGTIPALNFEQIDLAFLAADKAFSEWAKLDPQVRVQFIIEFSNELSIHTDLLADLLSQEVAKTFKESKTEVVRTIEYIQETIHQYLELINNPDIYSYDTEVSMPESKIGIYSRKPLGVVLTISPFNYPINLALAKIIPALLIGNTIVHKSATHGSLVGGYLFKLFDNVRLNRITPIPAGVVNFVTGKGSEIGNVLIKNKIIAAASFTGSTIIGREIAKQMIMKPYVLELGGKDPAIVCDDADLDLTAKEIVKGAYSFSGQRCTAIKRVLVTEKNADLLANKILSHVKTLKVGLAKDNCEITSVIENQTVELTKKLFEDAVNKRAVSLTGPLKINERLINPILLDYVTTDMEIAWVEPFSPILPIIRVKNLDEAIEITNQSEYGLQASVFSKDDELIKKINNQLNVGTVNQNKASSRGPDILPFSGVKNSGFGVQGIVPALLSFSRVQGLVLNKTSKK